MTGFTGVYFEATEGIEIANPDQIILILNLFYNPEWVAAFVMAGAIAGGLSTISGNLMAISAMVGSDLLEIVAPNMDDQKKVNLGYLAVAIGGIIVVLLAFRPPEFLVTSILWAFGMLATTITPGILLGVWWKKAHKLALVISSLLCGAIYIIISPHVLDAIVVGHGPTAELGMAGGLVTVPMAFALFIILSLIFDKVPSLNHLAPSDEEKRLVDYIHGWGNDYDENRYNWTGFPLIVALVCIGISIWGLMPW
ncbi:sodium:solute symporter family transporter [Natranaerofaba carboxydovora]|uniref:sodium:solute symporter family transporter n=1 Tax=Natranaerofaba carboxydovora TaxID=2742683 RepID=UPI003B8470D3